MNITNVYVVDDQHCSVMCRNQFRKKIIEDSLVLDIPPEKTTAVINW